jgi:4-amino-4-deoxy-L-arabinose transferase-like glycosyltransferase
LRAARLDGRFGRVALLLSCLAGLHGLAYLPLVDEHSVTDSRTYVAASEALLSGSYTTPLNAGFYYTYPVGFFDLSGVFMGQDFERWDVPERQSFRPPGYPAFLVPVGGGARGASETAAIVLQAVAFAAGALLLAFTVRRWWGERAALVATALYALDPYSKRYVVLILSEAAAALLALATAYAFTRAWQDRAARWWAAAAAAAAALTLVRAVFALAVPLLVLAALVRRERVLAVAASVGAAAALLVPWLAWTHTVTGHTVLANWGEGYNLLWAAHGEGYGRAASEVEASQPFQRDLEQTRASFPSEQALRTDPEAHPRYLADADRALRERAWTVYGERLRDAPADVAGEVMYRAGFLWSAHEDWYQPGGAGELALQLVDALVALLALVGIVLAVARRGPGALVGAFLLAYTLVLALHHVEARFTIPLRGLFLAFAAFALVQIRPRLARR